MNSGRCKENNRDKAIQTAKEGKDFVFRGLIKCAITGRTVICDEEIDKRGCQNIYLITRNPQDVKKRMFVKEKDILDKISQTFKSMQFPKELLESLTQYIQKAHKAEQEYYRTKINDIESKIRLEETKYNNLMDVRLVRSEGQIKSITKSCFE